MTGMPRPASFIRSTEPKPRWFAIIWTHEEQSATGPKTYVDQIFKAYAPNEEEALRIAQQAHERTYGTFEAKEIKK